MRKRVQRTHEAIIDLQFLLHGVKETSEAPLGGTSHSQTLQVVVDGMTEVFIDLVGIEHVNRTAFEKDIDGMFPEFIRAAALPFLRVHYEKPSSSERSIEKLNKQIQQAVASYSLRD
jgi:hypothetical protein